MRQAIWWLFQLYPKFRPDTTLPQDSYGRPTDIKRFYDGHVDRQGNFMDAWRLTSGSLYFRIAIAKNRFSTDVDIVGGCHLSGSEIERLRDWLLQICPIESEVTQ